MSGVARGFRGILSAACVIPSPFPYQCTTKKFEENGNTVSYKIIDGYCTRKVKENNKSENDDDRQNDTNDDNKINKNEEEEENNEQKENNLNSHQNETDEKSDTSQQSPKQQNLKQEENNSNENNNCNNTNEKCNDNDNDSNKNKDKDKDNNNNKEEEEEEVEEEPEFDYTFTVNDRTVRGNEEEELKSTIMDVCEHLRNNITLLFDSQITKFSLSFGVKTEEKKIWLLNGDLVTTLNGFTQNLLRSVPEGETAFTDFLVDQISETQPNTSLCFSNFPNSKCLKASYKVPRIFVILYRAHQNFPKVNEARLYRMIKSRIKGISEDVSSQTVNVCISCVHLYTAEQRTYQGQKLTNGLLKEVPPPTFAALVPAESSIRGLRDVGLNPHQYSPYCYKINVRDSPYKNKVPTKPPVELPERTKIGPVPKGEHWVDRLCNPYSTHSVKVTESPSPSARGYKEHVDVNVPNIPHTRKSYSEKKAPLTYADLPFTYAFLDKVKKKNEALMRKSQLSNRKWKNEYQ